MLSQNYLGSNIKISTMSLNYESFSFITYEVNVCNAANGCHVVSYNALCSPCGFWHNAWKLDIGYHAELDCKRHFRQ